MKLFKRRSLRSLTKFCNIELFKLNLENKIHLKSRVQTLL